ncbi:hypothetical protein [Tateyamaria sp.]|uniref:hypothetical protein n=1 Tax=Tateyamaria sp. TaxID=1929288 RepID=UPI003B20D747
MSPIRSFAINLLLFRIKHLNPHFPSTFRAFISILALEVITPFGFRDHWILTLAPCQAQPTVVLLYRELDEALGLFDKTRDTRKGKNGVHVMLRQSVFGRLAGYEDVNGWPVTDARLLVVGLLTGKPRLLHKWAALRLSPPPPTGTWPAPS